MEGKDGDAVARVVGVDTPRWHLVGPPSAHLHLHILARLYRAQYPGGWEIHPAAPSGAGTTPAP